MATKKKLVTKPADAESELNGGLGITSRRVLDPCCGSRMFWFDRQNPDVVFGDKRTETHVLCDGRTLRIEPDVTLDFTDLPFDDGTFKLVVFDPPHLHTAGPKSWMAAKYGKLTAIGERTCERVLQNAFACWPATGFWFSSGMKPK